MKIIKYEDAMRDANSDKCKTLEYSFNDKNLDLGIATITGRYPENGYCVNEVSQELIYVVEGSGNLCFENNKLSFLGDAILINPNEKYYWDTQYCIVTMTCSPAWTKEQHKIID